MEASNKPFAWERHAPFLTFFGAVLTLYLILFLTFGLQPPGAGEMTNDPQVKALLKAVRGQRVGLITNHSGLDRDLIPIADILHASKRCELVALFAPEHGLSGDHQAGAQLGDDRDAATSLPVYALYGVRRAPAAQQLENVDVLVFDIQDVGARFYTYVWTMTYAMEAAAKHGVRFVVFDRPNPVGLTKVEGPPNTRDYKLIGRVWPQQPRGVAVRHGMTAGELARLVNAEWLEPRVKLEVIRVPDYKRATPFAASGRPWVLPSPNMPTLDTALVYPGMCLFEGVNVSIGRGTARPFELVGAPFVDGRALARKLNALELPGARFRAATFTPTFGPYEDELCHGVQLHVTNPETFAPVSAGLHVLKALVSTHPDEIELRSRAGQLLGVPDLATRIRAERVDELEASWQKDLKAFQKLRRKHQLYD